MEESFWNIFTKPKFVKNITIDIKFKTKSVIKAQANGYNQVKILNRNNISKFH